MTPTPKDPVEALMKLVRAFGNCSPGDEEEAFAAVEASARALAAVPANRKSLRIQLQEKCSEWGTYWRASDAHGVELSRTQAIELLQDALGVEVAIDAGISPIAQQAGGVPAGWHEAVQRLVTGFEHVSGIARQWEPDHSSGADRAKWARATEACADVAKLLTAAPSPSAVQPLSEAPNYKGLLDKILTETTMGGILHAIEQARGIVWTRGIVTPKEPK